MRTSRRSITDLLLHLHPPTVPASTLRFSLSFGLGGMAAVLLGLLVATGPLLLLAYRPSVTGAYDSILFLTREAPFGRWTRNIHYLSANILAAAAMLHGARVVLTGAFGTGRRLNWIVGLLLLVLVLAANFTGYLLPWDQLAYWAGAICVNMLGYVPLCGQWLAELFRGGPEIGPGTLANFFTLHVAVIPAALLLFAAWHFWLVRRAGGLARGEGEADAVRVPVVPELIVREAAVGLSLVAVVLLAAMVFDAPLLEQANPAMSPNPAKAPWYFQGFQEILLHLHPVFAVFVWPVLAASALVALPFLPGAALPPGVWFGSTRGLKPAAWSALAGAGVAAGLILLDESAANAVPAADAANAWIARGLIPTVAAIALLFAGYKLLVGKFKRTRAEAVMSMLLFVLAAMAVCAVAGIWFRGPQMRLVWPFAGGGA